MEKHFLAYIRCAEHDASILFRHYVDHGQYTGAVHDIRAGITDTLSSSNDIPYLVYLSPQSRYFRQPEIYDKLCGMLDFTGRTMNADGTINYYKCNFHSAPDGAFMLLRFENVLEAMDKLSDDAELAVLRQKIEEIQHKLCKGILAGGFHTPNHRWIISAALACMYTRYNRNDVLPVIDGYLAEGMDCNDDGQYAERSAGGYDWINNHALILLANKLGKPELLEPVKRNLTLLRHLFEPNQEIFTEYSTRQDKATQVFQERYFMQFMVMSELTKDPLLMQEAARLDRQRVDSGRMAADDLQYYYRFPQLQTARLPQESSVLYATRNYLQSGIARHNRVGYSLTCITKSPNFLWMKTRELSMFLRIGIHFFDCRHFCADTITSEGDGWKLSWRGHGNYRLALDPPDPSSDWWQMDHTRRKTVMEQSLAIEVTIIPCEDGFDMAVQTQGCPDVPIRLEWNIAGGIELATKTATLLWNPGTRLVIHEGQVIARGLMSEMEMGPFFGENRLVDGLWGALPVSKDHMNCYCTQISHLDKRMQVRIR